MAILKRHRHGKNYTVKQMAEGKLTSGASGPGDGPIFTHMSIRLNNADDICSYALELTRDEAAQIVDNLTRYLERDTRKPMLVNGSKGHA